MYICIWHVHTERIRMIIASHQTLSLLAKYVCTCTCTSLSQLGQRSLPYMPKVRTNINRKVIEYIYRIYVWPIFSPYCIHIYVCNSTLHITRHHKYINIHKYIRTYIHMQGWRNRFSRPDSCLTNYS